MQISQVARPIRNNTDLGSDTSLVSNFCAYCVFSHDVMAAMFVSQTSPVGVEAFLIQTLSFVPINLHRCWPGKRRSADRQAAGSSPGRTNTQGL